MPEKYDHLPEWQRPLDVQVSELRHEIRDHVSYLKGRADILELQLFGNEKRNDPGIIGDVQQSISKTNILLNRCIGGLGVVALTVLGDIIVRLSGH